MNKIGDAPNISAFGFEFGAITTVSINDQKVFQGVAFGYAKRFSIGSEGVADIVIDPRAVPAEKSFILLPFKFQASGGGPVEIDLYAGTVSTETGTLWGEINRDGTSANTADTIVRLNPTISNIGTKLPIEYEIQSNGIPAVAAIGGAVSEDFILRLDKSVKYLIRLTNIDTAILRCTFAGNIFEVAEGI
jgi:hypothetical protein